MAGDPRKRLGANLTLLTMAGRGTAAIMLLPVALAGTAGAWRALLPGMVSWDFASDALLDSVRGSGPVAAGLAAWITIASGRSGLGRLERPGRRSAAAGPLTRLAVAASAALAGYALTAITVAAWLGLHAGVTGHLQPAEVAAGGAVLVAHVTTGFLIALLLSVRRYPVRRGGCTGQARGCPGQRAARWMVSARRGLARLLPAASHAPGGAATGGAVAFAAVLGATWALDAWSAASPSRGARWPRLLLSPDVHHSPFTQWRPGFFVAVLTWFCGLVAATVLVSGWALTRRHRYAIAFVAASAMAGVGLGQVRADAAHPIIAVSASAVCRTWPLQVCVNPAFASALPQLELVFTAVAAEVSGTRAAVRSVTQLPPGARTAFRPGGYSFHLDDLGQGYALRAESDLTRQVAAALDQGVRSPGARSRGARSWGARSWGARGRAARNRRPRNQGPSAGVPAAGGPSAAGPSAGRPIAGRYCAASRRRPTSVTAPASHRRAQRRGLLSVSAIRCRRWTGACGHVHARGTSPTPRMSPASVTGCRRRARSAYAGAACAAGRSYPVRHGSRVPVATCRGYAATGKYGAY